MCGCLTGATSRFVQFQKLSLNFCKFVVCNPCQSSPSLTILVPLLFIIISLVFFYLGKLLFSGFLQIKGNFALYYVNCTLKTGDWAPLMNCTREIKD